MLRRLQTIHTGRNLTLKTGAKLTANARFICTSRNVVYVMICLGCKEFYVGETGDTLRNRFTVHRQKMALEPKNAPVPVDPHLRTCGGGRYKVLQFSMPNNISIIHRRSLDSCFKTKIKHFGLIARVVMETTKQQYQHVQHKRPIRRSQSEDILKTFILFFKCIRYYAD